MKKLLLISLLLCISSILTAQLKPVAKAGARTITQSEFRDRYEFTPWNKEIRSLPAEGLKKEFLYTLIAEKLFSQKASELGYDTSLAFRTKIKVIEKMYVRDALYRSEIMEKVILTEEELEDAYYRMHTKLYGTFISANDQLSIKKMHQLLLEGADYDSIYNSFNNNLKDTLTISFGKFNKEIEDSLYRLMPGDFSFPFEFSGSWYIVKVDGIARIEPRTNREENVLVSESKKIAAARKTSNYYEQYLNKFLADKKTDVNGKVYQQVASEMISLLLEKWKSAGSDTDKVYLSENDFNRIRKDLGDEIINSVLIRSGEQTATVSDFLDNIYYYENSYSTSDPKEIKKIISNMLLEFMRNELLAAEGYRRGLHLTDEVNSQVQIWRDNYLFNILKNTVLDSSRVTDEDVYDYYKKRNDYASSTKIKIIEVITDNLDDIAKVLDEKGNGTDFHQLALKYSNKQLERFYKGVSDYLPADSLGELGRIAMSMNEGDIYGPIKIQEGYSVFQLIDKKESANEDTAPFELVKKELKKSLQGLRNYHSLVNYTAGLARQYDISIDEKILSSVEVTNIYSIMFRYMGFGGRILAAPMIVPFTEWTEQLDIPINTP